MTSLILDCNPNTIEMLGTSPKQIFYINNYGKLLKDNVDLFLSKKAINSFGGYATQQLRRWENARARDEYPMSEKEKHILQTIQLQLKTIENRYQSLGDGSIKLYIDTSEKTDRKTEIFIDTDIKHYPLRDFKNIHSEMLNVIHDYDKLNARNKKKDDCHLNKHIMHLIRLLITGTDILTGKGIITYRADKHDLLMNIRNGRYSVSELYELINIYTNKFEYASNNCILPAKPQYSKVEELLMTIYLDYLKA